MIDLKNLADDPYQDIYDEVEANIDRTDKDDLFSYCLEVCEKIFAIAEADYGKRPRNLPKGLLEEIGMDLFEFRRTKIVSEKDLLKRIKYMFWSCACDKYGADKEYDINQKFTSLHNLENLLQDVLPIENYLPEIKRKIRHVRTTYLPAFFGIKYSKDDSAEVKFEKLRLILILYSVKENMDIDLGYLLKKVSLRSMCLPETYKKGVDYIKEMVGKRLSYVDVMQLERWVSSEYNGIRLLEYELINLTLQQMEYVNCDISRKVMEKIYILLCNRLTLASCYKKALQAKTPVEVDAYIHFSERVVFGDFSVTSIKQMKWMNIQSEAYEAVAAIQAKSKQDTVFIDFDDVKNFISQNLYEITDLITNNKAEHKDRVRILDENSIRDYLMMVRVYQLGFHVKKEHRKAVTTNIILWLIFLYEGCKRNDVDFSLIDRSGKCSRRKNIHSVLSKIIDCEQDEEFLLKNWHYVKIINWLVHKIFMIKTYRTPYVVVLQRRVQKKIRRFWKNNIPILAGNTLQCKYQCIEDMGKELINVEEIKNIIWEINNN